MPIHLLWAPCIAHVDRMFLSRLLVLMHHGSEVLESQYFEENFETLRKEVATYGISGHGENHEGQTQTRGVREGV